MQLTNEYRFEHVPVGATLESHPMGRYNGEYPRGDSVVEAAATLPAASDGHYWRLDTGEVPFKRVPKAVSP